MKKCLLLPILCLLIDLKGVCQDLDPDIVMPPVFLNVCEGDIFTTLANTGVQHELQHVLHSNPSCYLEEIYNRANMKEFVVEPNGLVNIDAENYVSREGYPSVFIRSITYRATNSTTIIITSTRRGEVKIEGENCLKVREKYGYKVVYTYHVTVYKKNILPTIKVNATPKIGGTPPTVQILAEGCEANDYVSWRPLNGILFQTTGNKLTLGDPYDCTEYEVSCSNRFCPRYESRWTAPIRPADSFILDPNRSGYDPDFSNFLNNQANKAIGKPEYGYRRQFACIQQKTREEYARTGENGWGAGFPKHLFDDIAKNKACEGSANYLCKYATSPTMCFWEAGAFSHGWEELKPGFFSYNPGNLPFFGGFNEWNRQHEGFLINAVGTCFQELDQDPNFTGTKGIYYDLVALNARGLRNIAQWHYSANEIKTKFIQLSTMLNLSLSVLESAYSNLPVPLTREQLFSQKAYSSSEIKVAAGNNYFLKTNSSTQINIQTSTPAGRASYFNAVQAGVTYSLSVDPSVATISETGLLTIHSTTDPMVNGRLPLYVTVTSEGKTGIGQFAIYDTDKDGDMIADSYERRIGLNPNVKNDLKSDLDGDDLLDLFEVNYGSDPLKKDTDGDGYDDLQEYLRGTSPTNDLSFPLLITSLASGNWNNPATWSCNCVPTETADVVIQAGHTILLDATMQKAASRNLKLLGKLSIKNNTITVKGGR